MANADASLVGPIQSANGIEQGGFATAGRSDNGSELPSFKAEADMIHGGHITGFAGVNFQDIVQLNQAHNRGN